MKVAVIGTRGFPHVQGGVETHCENLYPRLVPLGCEVIVFTRRPYVDTTRRSFRGVTFIHLPCVKQKYLEAFLHTFMGVFLAAVMRPDVLHIHTIGPALLAPLARVAGLKVVITHQGPDYQREKWGPLAKAVLRTGERWGMRFAHAVIAVSHAIADDIKIKYARHALVIPNGVAPARIARANGALRELGLCAGRYILSVGRFVPEKGFMDLIGAFDELDREQTWIREKGWKLALVGKADHPDAFSQKVAATARNNKRIVLTGFLTGDTLREVFSNAGMFILPSYHEGLPLALLEALGYGLVCAASDISAHRELGLLSDRYFAPGAIEQIKRVIVRCAQESVSSREKDAQIARVRQQFDWDSIAAKTLAVYTGICARTRHGRKTPV